MRNTLEHLDQAKKKPRPETATINTKSMYKSTIKFLSTYEVGADGFKLEEKASMRYIPNSKFGSSKIRLKVKKDPKNYTY